MQFPLKKIEFKVKKKKKKKKKRERKGCTKSALLRQPSLQDRTPTQAVQRTAPVRAARSQGTHTTSTSTTTTSNTSTSSTSTPRTSAGAGTIRGERAGTQRIAEEQGFLT